MNTPAAGFVEIEHTADWSLRVWAPDLPGLLEQAARGMLQLSGIDVVETREERVMQVEAADSEICWSTSLLSFYTFSTKRAWLSMSTDLKLQTIL